jgi:hypothetical protein
MTPRELFERAVVAIEAGDVDALLGCYHPLALQLDVRHAVRGREALRPRFEGWLASRPKVEVRAFAEAEDTLVYEVETDEGRGYGTLVVRDGLIWRQTQGLFPVQATAASVADAGRGPVAVELDAYIAWSPRDVPDPRTAGKDTLMPVLMEIVEAEGPILAGRAFGLYTRASGGKKLTTAAKAPLAGACWRLKIQDRLVIGREDATTITDEDVLRPAGSPPVRVRELGPRTLEEVPLDEVAELMERLATAGASDLKRAVLDTYGLIRLTARADQYLEEALTLASAPR